MDTETIVRFVPLAAAVIVVALVHQFIIKPRVMKVGGKKDPLEAVRYFRKLGFFEGYEASTDEELAAGIERKHQETWGRPLDPKDPLFDLYLLAWDKKRVWCKAPMEVAMGKDIYVNTLKDWAAISRGAFVPQDIKETWEGPEGPIRISFTADGQEYEFEPEYDEEGLYLDHGLTGPVWTATRSSDYSLLKLSPFAPAPFIFFLTQQEVGKLMTERRWDFKKLVFTGENWNSILHAEVGPGS